MGGPDRGGKKGVSLATTEGSEKTAELTSLVTPDMEERRGVWVEGRTSPPISESDIRKWAIASYWPEEPPRLFWDAEYAKTTRWGGVIAPQDFNPFAWPIHREQQRVDPGSSQAAGGVRLAGMNGGQVDTYDVPMRPGDTITSRGRLRDWSERQTRLGLTMFVNNETEWRDQHGKLVKRRISTSIRYIVS